jgi:WD40 repeat-containing protein SMU1
MLFHFIYCNCFFFSFQMLRTTEPLCIMRAEQPERYARLEALTHRPVFVASDAYEIGTNKDKRRREVAAQLTAELSVVPPSRLVALIGQALRFQEAQGTLPADGSIDLFRGGRRKARKDNEEKIPQKQAGVIKFSPESHPETCIFAPDGSGLVTGSVDGFIEVWDVDQCRLRKDLDYQAKDELMMHEEPVLCTTFNRDGELLATGSQDGKVKIWKLSTGQCLRKFSKAHAEGVTSLCFSKDSSQILSGSFDHLARIHGLKSGKTLKEFR